MRTNAFATRTFQNATRSLPAAACHPGVRHILRGARVQPKLRVGAVDDPAEREADRIADQVMRTPDPPVAASSAPVGVQRLCAECEEQVQRRPMEEEEEELLQTKQAAGSNPAVTPKVAADIATMRGGGQPLPASERAFFEPRFGRDFSQVRIHTGPRADAAARAIDARAFTLGNDIAFNAGARQPFTASGQWLLAHELAHVVQQTTNRREAETPRQSPHGQSTTAVIQRQGEPSVRVTLSYTRCNATQARAIAEGIPGAKAMVWTAITWMLSFNPRDRARVNAMLRNNFRSDSEDTFDTVKNRLVMIHTALTNAQNGAVTFDCAPASDPECEGRDGYVLTTDRSVHICPGFFNNSLHERQWMLIHEFAHVAGALSGQETYHAVFGAVDCNDTTGVPTRGEAIGNADNYSRFVWCLTQRPGTILTPVVP